MNQADHKRVMKALEQLERKTRRKGRPGKFSTSPIVFDAGLGLAYFLLLEFVPRAWSTLLPGGLEQAATLQGQAAEVLRLAILVDRFRSLIPVAIIAASLMMLVVGSTSKFARFASWLSAFGVIGFNIWIVGTVLRASWALNAAAAGLPDLLN